MRSGLLPMAGRTSRSNILPQATIAVLAADAVLEPGLEELTHRRDSRLCRRLRGSGGPFLLGALFAKVYAVSSETLDAGVLSDGLSQGHVSGVTGAAVRTGQRYRLEKH